MEIRHIFNDSLRIKEPDFARHLHTISPNHGCGDNSFEHRACTI